MKGSESPIEPRWREQGENWVELWITWEWSRSVCCFALLLLATFCVIRLGCIKISLGSVTLCKLFIYLAVWRSCHNPEKTKVKLVLKTWKVLSGKEQVLQKRDIGISSLSLRRKLWPWSAEIKENLSPRRGDFRCPCFIFPRLTHSLRYSEQPGCLDGIYLSWHKSY